MQADEKTLRSIIETSQLPEYTVLDADFVNDKNNKVMVPDPEKQLARKELDLVKLAYLHVQGYTTPEIMKELGVSRQVVATLRSSAQFKIVLNTLTQEIVTASRTFLSAAGLKAVRTLLTCMDSPDERVKMKAATEVLDRIGVSSPEEIRILGASEKLGAMSDEELVNIVKLGVKEVMPLTKEAGNGKGSNTD